MLKEKLLADPLINQAFSQGQQFFRDRDRNLAIHREAVNTRIKTALRGFRGILDRASIPTQHMETLLNDICGYVEWLGWSLDDIGFFSLMLSIDSDLMARRIVACHFIYQSGRLFDDVIDEHKSYKGLNATPLGQRRHYWQSRHTNDTRHADKEILLIAVALLLQGISDYSACFGPTVPTDAIRSLTATASSACLGALLELNEQLDNDRNSYHELVKLKSTAHNAILLQPFYGLVSPCTYDQLHDFYQRTSLLGQIFNDAVDIEEDCQSGQINYFLNEDTERASALTPAEVEQLSSLLRELADTIQQRYIPSLHTPCYAKFSTFITKAEQIETQ